MKLRKFAAALPVVAALAIVAPVATANAQTTSTSSSSPGSSIPCYPYPAFCGPNGQPWFPFFPFQLTPPQTVQLPTPTLPVPFPVQGTPATS